MLVDGQQVMALAVLGQNRFDQKAIWEILSIAP